MLAAVSTSPSQTSSAGGSSWTHRYTMPRCGPVTPRQAAGACGNLLPPHYEIARVAYGIWDQAGRPQGRDQEHWIAAMARLRDPSPDLASGTIAFSPQRTQRDAEEKTT
jgi:Protein of unknown function (DUF2934)